MIILYIYLKIHKQFQLVIQPIRPIFGRYIIVITKMRKISILATKSLPGANAGCRSNIPLYIPLLEQKNRAIYIQYDVVASAELGAYLPHWVPATEPASNTRFVLASRLEMLAE
jgi:hypothetical protein